MLTYPWKCTVLHCNHLGNTWKPLVLMTRCWKPLVLMTRYRSGNTQSVRSSVPVVSRCFPGGYNVKLYISRGRLAWWLLAFLHSVGIQNIYVKCTTHHPYPPCMWAFAWHSHMSFKVTLHKKATIYQVTTMLATSKIVLFPGHNHHANHQYWQSDTLIITLAAARAIISVGLSVPVVITWIKDIFKEWLAWWLPGG